jgi:hypothetical protein
MRQIVVMPGGEDISSSRIPAMVWGPARHAAMSWETRGWEIP